MLFICGASGRFLVLNNIFFGSVCNDDNAQNVCCFSYTWVITVVVTSKPFHSKMQLSDQNNKRTCSPPHTHTNYVGTTIHLDFRQHLLCSGQR